MSVRSQTMQPKDWATKAPGYINEAKLLNVKILSPSINSSSLDFTIHNNTIYFGFSGIKGVGKAAAQAIVDARDDRPFKSIEDFVQRISLQKVNTRSLESLVDAGTFDTLGYYRKDLLDNIHSLYSYIRATQEYYQRIVENKQREKENEKIIPLIAKKKELQRIARLKKERDLTEVEEVFLEEVKGLRIKKPLKVQEPEKLKLIPRYKQVELTLKDIITQGKYLGCYINIHPAHLAFRNTTPINQLEDKTKEQTAGAVDKVTKIYDKNGKKMAFVSFSDETGSAEIVIFARLYKKLINQHKIPEEGDLIKIIGKVQVNESRVGIVADDIFIYRSNE